MSKEKISIEIEITCIKDDELGFETSLEQVFEKLKEGYEMGRDGNENEEYKINFIKNMPDFSNRLWDSRSGFGCYRARDKYKGRTALRKGK